MPLSQFVFNFLSSWQWKNIASHADTYSSGTTNGRCNSLYSSPSLGNLRCTQHNLQWVFYLFEVLEHYQNSLRVRHNSYWCQDWRVEPHRHTAAFVWLPCSKFKWDRIEKYCKNQANDNYRVYNRATFVGCLRPDSPLEFLFSALWPESYELQPLSKIGSMIKICAELWKKRELPFRVQQ